MPHITLYDGRTATIPAEILTPGTTLYTARSPWCDAGAKVVIHARGKFRRGVIEKAGPARTTVAYASPSTGKVTRKAVAHADVYTERDDDGGSFAGVVREVSAAARGHKGYGQYLEAA